MNKLDNHSSHAVMLAVRLHMRTPDTLQILDHRYGSGGGRKQI